MFTKASPLRVLRYFFFVLTTAVAVATLFFLQALDTKSNRLDISATNKIMTTKKISGWKYCYKENSSTIIFLHLTNKTDRWSSLEMCAFKSAAETNPEAGVCVLTKSIMRQHPNLKTVPNLEFALLNISLILKNTPIVEWYEKSFLKTSSNNAVWELSDALRVAYLFNYGGKYMDTDVLTLRNLGSLRNVTCGERPGVVSTSVLIFDKGHPLIEAVLDSVEKAYVPGVWGCIGPALFKEVHDSGSVDNSTYTVLEVRAFYPVHWVSYKMFFTPEDKEKVKNSLNESYVLHYWHYRIYLENNSYALVPNGSYLDEFINTRCM